MAMACFWEVTFGPVLLPEWSFPAFHLSNTFELGMLATFTKEFSFTNNFWWFWKTDLAKELI